MNASRISRAAPPRAVTSLPPAAALALRHSVERAAAAAELVYLDDNGATRVIDVKLRPRVIDRAQLHAYAALARLVVLAQRRVARAYFASPALQRALPLEGREAAVLGDLHARGALLGPVIARLDTNAPLGRASWQRGLRFFELNAVGVGGMDYATTSERIVRRELGRALGPLPLRAGPDLRDLLLHEIRRHARRIGVERRVLSVALLEERAPGGTRELFAFARHFARRGVRAVVADPRDLALDRGRVIAGGAPVDVVYRDIELRDLLALDGGRAGVSAALHAMRERRVLSAPCAEFDHKSLLEVLSDDELAAPLLPGAGERAALRAHALWTRLLYPRRTRAWDGRDVDLYEFARRGRERLVIKPNRAFGGKGVVLGPETTPRDWARSLDAAVREPSTHVVQRFAEMPREPFPTIDDAGRVTSPARFTDCGIYAIGRHVGFLTRVAPRRIVNVSSGGGLGAVLRSA